MIVREFKSILFIVGFAFAGMLGAYQADDGELLVTQPMQTKRCLVEGRFSCQEYEYTYSVRGISCTEECLAFSRLNTCQLTNRCDWDPASGCFRKRVCVALSEINTCRRWETEAVCD